MTADNASSNNVQVAALYRLENSFDEANHVRCFNHTIQLSGKALIKPFNAGMSKAGSGSENTQNSTGDAPSLEEFNYDDDTDDGVDASLFEDGDEGDGDGDGDGENESETLSEEERASLLIDTSAVRETVSKVSLRSICFTISDIGDSQVRQLSFAIIHSTTIALPAWRRFCQAHNLKPKLIPRDVVTRWNSTHDMMVFALKYRKPIDSITADKSLKLRKYELDNEGWGIIEQLVSVLQVNTTRPVCSTYTNARTFLAIQVGNVVFLPGFCEYSRCDSSDGHPD